MIEPRWKDLPGVGRTIPLTLAQADHLREMEQTVAPPGLPSVSVEDEFWSRGSKHFRLRLIRRWIKKARIGTQIFKPEEIPRIASALADCLLWKLVPKRERPPGWPKNESELATLHGITVYGLRLWMRYGNFEDVKAKVGPLWSTEEVKKELVDRVTDRAFQDLDQTDPDHFEPRYVDLALKAQKVIGQSPRIENLSLTKNEVNITSADADEVRRLIAQVTQAAKELGMGGMDVESTARELAPGEVKELGGTPRPRETQ